jgi:hypothetical protein
MMLMMILVVFGAKASVAAFSRFPSNIRIGMKKD